MGQDGSTNGNDNNERLPSEYNEYSNSMNEKEEYSINVNKSYFNPGIENLNNKNNSRNQNTRKILLGKKNGINNVSNTLPDTFTKNKFNIRNPSEENSFLSKDIQKYNINNTINY